MEKIFLKFFIIVHLSFCMYSGVEQKKDAQTSKKKPNTLTGRVVPLKINHSIQTASPSTPSTNNKDVIFNALKKLNNDPTLVEKKKQKYEENYKDNNKNHVNLDGHVQSFSNGDENTGIDSSASENSNDVIQKGNKTFNSPMGNNKIDQLITKLDYTISTLNKIRQNMKPPPTNSPAPAPNSPVKSQPATTYSKLNSKIKTNKKKKPQKKVGKRKAKKIAKFPAPISHNIVKRSVISAETPSSTLSEQNVHEASEAPSFTQFYEKAVRIRRSLSRPKKRVKQRINLTIEGKCYEDVIILHQKVIELYYALNSKPKTIKASTNDSAIVQAYHSALKDFYKAFNTTRDSRCATIRIVPSNKYFATVDKGHIILSSLPLIPFVNFANSLAESPHKAILNKAIEKPKPPLNKTKPSKNLLQLFVGNSTKTKGKFDQFSSPPNTEHVVQYSRPQLAYFHKTLNNANATTQNNHKFLNYDTPSTNSSINHNKNRYNHTDVMLFHENSTSNDMNDANDLPIDFDHETTSEYEISSSVSTTPAPFMGSTSKEHSSSSSSPAAFVEANHEQNANESTEKEQPKHHKEDSQHYNDRILELLFNNSLHSKNNESSVDNDEDYSSSNYKVVNEVDSSPAPNSKNISTNLNSKNQNFTDSDSVSAGSAVNKLVQDTPKNFYSENSSSDTTTFATSTTTKSPMAGTTPNTYHPRNKSMSTYYEAFEKLHLWNENPIGYLNATATNPITVSFKSSSNGSTAKNYTDKVMAPVNNTNIYYLNVSISANRNFGQDGVSEGAESTPSPSPVVANVHVHAYNNPSPDFTSNIDLNSNNTQIENPSTEVSSQNEDSSKTTTTNQPNTPNPQDQQQPILVKVENTLVSPPQKLYDDTSTSVPPPVVAVYSPNSQPYPPSQTNSINTPLPLAAQITYPPTTPQTIADLSSNTYDAAAAAAQTSYTPNTDTAAPFQAVYSPVSAPVAMYEPLPPAYNPTTPPSGVPMDYYPQVDSSYSSSTTMPPYAESSVVPTETDTGTTVNYTTNNSTLQTGSANNSNITQIETVHKQLASGNADQISPAHLGSEEAQESVTHGEENATYNLSKSISAASNNEQSMAVLSSGVASTNKTSDFESVQPKTQQSYEANVGDSSQTAYDQSTTAQNTPSNEPNDVQIASTENSFNTADTSTGNAVENGNYATSNGYETRVGGEQIDATNPTSAPSFSSEGVLPGSSDDASDGATTSSPNPSAAYSRSGIHSKRYQSSDKQSLGDGDVASGPQQQFYFKEVRPTATKFRPLTRRRSHIFGSPHSSNRRNLDRSLPNKNTFNKKKRTTASNSVLRPKSMLHSTARLTNHLPLTIATGKYRKKSIYKRDNILRYSVD